MPSRDWKFRLEDILNSIEKIEEYLADQTLESFIQNTLIVDAVIRNFEIIGEASVHLPDSVKSHYPHVPWAQMRGIRNILIHEYFGVDVDTLWHTSINIFPRLKKELKIILEDVKT